MTLKSKNAESDERERIGNVIWMCFIAGFSTNYALAYLNSGILGHRIDPVTDRPIARTISQATYFRIKKENSESDKIRNDFENFVVDGFRSIVRGFLSELKELHSLSLDNLNREKDPSKRQFIINSIINTVIPSITQYADITRKMIKAKSLLKMLLSICNIFTYFYILFRAKFRVRCN